MNSKSTEVATANAAALASSQPVDRDGASLPPHRFELEVWANDGANDDGSPSKSDGQREEEEETETAWLRATRATGRAPRAFGMGRGLLFRRNGGRGGGGGGGGPLRHQNKATQESNHLIGSLRAAALPVKPKSRHERGYRAMVDSSSSSSSTSWVSSNEDESLTRSNSYSLFSSTSMTLGSSGTLPEEEPFEGPPPPPSEKERSIAAPNASQATLAGNVENFPNHRQLGLRRANSQPMTTSVHRRCATNALPLEEPRLVRRTSLTAAFETSANDNTSSATSDNRCRISPPPPPRVRLHRRNSTMTSVGGNQHHNGQHMPSDFPSSLEELDRRVAGRPPPPPPLPPARPRRANTYSGAPSMASSSLVQLRRYRTASSSSFEDYLGLTAPSSPPALQGDWSWPEELLEQDPLDELEGQRERKKIRPLCSKPIGGARSASVGLSAPSMHHRGNSCSDLLRQSKHEWDQIELSHALPSPPLANLFPDEPLAVEDATGQPPLPPSPARSVASLSRKRGVAGGSPLGFSSSEWDDWSAGGGLAAMDASNNSSSSSFTNPNWSTVRPRPRSRIYSPDPSSLPLPFGHSTTINPSLPPPHPNRYHSNPSPDPTAARDVMDIDSEDDDDNESRSNDGFLDSSDRDSSFESSNRDPPSHSFRVSARGGGKPPQVPLRLVETEQDVLESMPSYNDLKFVISSLRHQSCARVNFHCASWQLCPRLRWEPTRRAGLIQWATRHLGFALRAIGGSHSYLQISKARGLDLLVKLEQSRALYKQEQGEPELSRMSAKRTTPAPTASIVQNDEPFDPMDVSRSHQKLEASPSLQTQFADAITSDLVTQMRSLAVVDAPRRSSSSTQGRPPSLYGAFDHPAHLTPRPNAPPAPPRPSFDVPPLKSGDMLFQLQGNSPAIDDEISLRPPRLSSLSTRLSTGLRAEYHRTSAPLTTAAPIGAALSFDVLETPLMKPDDFWGSCPVDGRDWGGSSRCQDACLSELMGQFQTSCTLAGPEPRDSMEGFCPRLPLSAELTCSQLQFDVEEVAVEDDTEIDQEIEIMMPVATQTSSEPEVSDKETRRMRLSIEMHRRRSVYFAAAHSGDSEVIRPSGLFKARSLTQSDEFGEVLPTANEKEISKIPRLVEESAVALILDEPVLSIIFSFLNESELLRSASQVCTSWADMAASARANLMLASIRFADDYDEDDPRHSVNSFRNPIAASMERDWQHLNSHFPWGQYLSEGGMKRVYKVYNRAAEAEEAISVMDVDSIIDKQMLGAELAVSCLLSTFPRRGICPNFVITRGVFTCAYDAPSNRWGSAENKRPQGNCYDASFNYKIPRPPASKFRGVYQYIRMEYCNCGDVEEYIKKQDDGLIVPSVAQGLLFQMAFGLHAAADRYSVKHYDIKLLNIFLQMLDVAGGELVLRYGLGSHFFAVRMPPQAALIAKIADYGTADIRPASNGQPVTIAQFTTLENTPPDFIILGDLATQGHGHDSFALGLCMIHLFTGHEPYEEILASVKCSPVLKRKLRAIFEVEDVHGYHTIRSVILQDVYQDEAGHILEGEPDMTLYDTFYRYLVLFGIPEDKFDRVRCPLVWNAVEEALEGKVLGGRSRSQTVKRKCAPDGPQFARDQKIYSIRQGTNKYIARARKVLEQAPGGLDLLFHLCSFDPSKRASAMDVLNSAFMENLREPVSDGELDAARALYRPEDAVYTYAAFSTRR